MNKRLLQDRGRYYTRNRVPGKRVYGERLKLARGKEFRDWTPYRSKMAALMQRDPKARLPDPNQDILYLGAATGTTVSHLSDLAQDGLVYAVEFSPRCVRDLLVVADARDNIIPILADARRPDDYAAYIDRPVGALVQDVAQPDQVEIFLRNLHHLAPGGTGYLFVKARSIHVAKATKEIFSEVTKQVQDAGLDVVARVRLEPFEKDHLALVVKRK